MSSELAVQGMSPWGVSLSVSGAKLSYAGEVPLAAKRQGMAPALDVRLSGCLGVGREAQGDSPGCQLLRRPSCCGWYRGRCCSSVILVMIRMRPRDEILVCEAVDRRFWFVRQ